ncbi:MAG: hypothetical protein WBQ34_09470 [Candidatus Acidiferrales bacterium]
MAKANIQEVKRLLEAGFTFRLVALETSWTKGELSTLCKAWSLKRPRGRRPRTEKQ